MSQIEIEHQHSIDDYESLDINIHQILSLEQLDSIDDILLSLITEQPRKSAYIIGKTLTFIKYSMFGYYQNKIDMLLAQRLDQLVKEGKIQAKGDVRAIRFSEVYI